MVMREGEGKEGGRERGRETKWEGIWYIFIVCYLFHAISFMQTALHIPLKYAHLCPVFLECVVLIAA